MYAQRFMWRSLIDIRCRQNGNGLSLPVTPPIHGESTTRIISNGSTPRYLNIRRSMAFLLILPAPPCPRTAVLSRLLRLAQIYVPMIRVTQQRPLMIVEPKSDPERWFQRMIP